MWTCKLPVSARLPQVPNCPPCLLVSCVELKWDKVMRNQILKNMDTSYLLQAPFRGLALLDRLLGHIKFMWF